MGIRACDCKHDVHWNTGSLILRACNVGFLIEVFWALLMVGIPIGIFTLAIVWWSLEKGHFQGNVGVYLRLLVLKDSLRFVSKLLRIH